MSCQTLEDLPLSPAPPGRMQGLGYATFPQQESNLLARPSEDFKNWGGGKKRGTEAQALTDGPFLPQVLPQPLKT